MSRQTKLPFCKPSPIIVDPQSNWSADSTATANGLLLSITQFDVALENARAQVDTFHETCFEEAVHLSESIGAPGPALPRICSR